MEGGPMRYSLTPVLRMDVPESLPNASHGALRVLTLLPETRCRRVNNKENVRAHSSGCGDGGELVSWQRAR